MMGQEQDEQQHRSSLYKTYFHKYDNLLPKQAHQTGNVQAKICQEISSGALQICEERQMTVNISRISKDIKFKSADLNKQLIMLNISLKKNQNSQIKAKMRSNSARSNLSFRSASEVSHEDLEEYRYRNLQASRRLKELKRIKQEIQEKKLKTEIQKKQKQAVYSRIKTEREAAQELRFKAQKEEKIKQRLNELQQKRQQRIAIIKNSLAKSSPTLPLYKRMQKGFEQRNLESQIIERIKVNQKTMQKYKDSNFQSIKRHEAEYLERVKRQFNRSAVRERSKTEQMQAKHKQQQNRFRLIGEDPEVIQNRKKNRLKVKQFQQKSSRIRIKTNIQKYVEVEILKDRSKNPFKYHYLKKKKYSEKQIYRGFADFQLKKDRKLIGNSYLKSVNRDNSQRNRSNPSSRVLVTQPRVPILKDYLLENKKMASKKKRDSMDQMLKMFGNKSEAVAYMQEKAQMHNAKALHKILSLQNEKGYEESLATEKEIDQEFINSVKSKLRCLQLK